MELHSSIKLTKEETAYFAAVRSNFGVFLQQAFHTIYPNKEFLNNWHIDAIVHCLEPVSYTHLDVYKRQVL